MNRQWRGGGGEGGIVILYEGMLQWEARKENAVSFITKSPFAIHSTNLYVLLFWPPQDILLFSLLLQASPQEYSQGLMTNLKKKKQIIESIFFLI